MRNIGGKLFIGINPVIKRGNHPAQRNRQPSDFIGPCRHIGNADTPGVQLACVPVAAQFGSGSQIGQWIGNGRGQHKA